MILIKHKQAIYKTKTEKERREAIYFVKDFKRNSQKNRKGKLFRGVNGFNYHIKSLKLERWREIQNSIMWSLQAIDIRYKDIAKSKMKIMGKKFHVNTIERNICTGIRKDTYQILIELISRCRST